MANTARGFLNNYSSTLSGAITDVATSITVSSDTAVAATLALDYVDFVSLTIDDGTNIEIVHCTAASGAGALTVSRGEEGTTGTAFADGVAIEARLTSQGLREVSEWQLVDKVSLTSAASNIDFALDSGTYKVVLDNVGSLSDNVELQVLLGTGAGPTFQTTQYYFGSMIMSSTGAGSDVDTGFNVSSIVIFHESNFEDARRIFGEFFIGNVDSTVVQSSMRWFVNEMTVSNTGAGVRGAAEAITALRFQFSSGNFRTGSTLLLYKKNSL